MDQESQKMLDQILAKEPVALTDDEKSFLRARSSYLNEEQRVVYGEVLEVAQKPSSEPVNEPETLPEGESSETQETGQEQTVKKGRRPRVE